MNSRQRRVSSARYVPRHTAGITGTGHFGKFGTTSIPVPDAWVNSVRHQYQYRTLRQVRYDMDTGTAHFGKFGTISIPVPLVPVQTFIPVPGASVISVQYQYRYRTLRYVRNDINTGAGHFGKFGTTSIPVPRIPVPYRTHPCIFLLMY